MNRAERRQVVPSRAQLASQAKRRRVIVLASFGVLAVIIVIAVALSSRVPKAASDAPISATLHVGQQAPEFAVSTTGGPFDIAHAGDKPTLLEVFATWCPHCQHETVVLDNLYATYKDRANIVAVSGSPYGMDSSQPESQADVVDFMTKFNVQYPVAFDPNLSVAKAYLQGGFPTIVLIGRDGTVAAIRDGEIPIADLKSVLDAALSGKKPDPKMGAKG
jgi:thiol-disulfide isomerase/thioredoxin